MMTEMTRYKQQTDVDDDTSSVGSARTEDLGTTTVHYHLGSNWWRSRTALEKALLVGWLLLLLLVTVLVAILHMQRRPQTAIHMHLPIDLPSTHLLNVTQEACSTPECVMLAGSVLSNMDLTADPCEDFYQYACGGWAAKNTIPEGKPVWGTLYKLASDNQLIMKNVLESEDKTVSKAENKARIFYRSCMDVASIEAQGAKPLQDLIQKFKGWSISGNWSVRDFDLLQDVHNSKVVYGSGALFSWQVADDKNSSSLVLQFDEGGLMLPARLYYLNESEKAVVDAYKGFIQKIGVLLGAGEDAALEVAEGILDIEHRLAEITTPDEERRDDNKTYHTTTIQDLNDQAPFMDWLKFINTAFRQVNKQLDSTTTIVVSSMDFFGNLTEIVESLNSTEKGRTNLHNYLVWHAVRSFVPVLAQDFREASKDLEKAQMGVEGTEEAWRECVVATDAALGPALGAMYIRQALQNNSRAVAEDMIRRIRKTFTMNLLKLEWMDKKTIKAAVEKADDITEMIGYPDYILNPSELDSKYGDLVIDKDYFANNVRVVDFKIKEDLLRLFKPVNKTRWDMSPPTVNAYYAPTRNEIVLPAGILQPPIFSQGGAKSLNFGAVGVVMGHELAHAFDDQGSKYDKNGNLNRWWNQDTEDKFSNLTQCMVRQYSAYDLRGEHVNGKLTLGENIADNAGLKAAYHAYQDWVRENGPERPLPGLNLHHNQIFFIGFSQVWCSAMTKEAAHLELMKDPHVPGMFRVLGPLSNSRDFAKAYQCRRNSRMNPTKKCSVW